MRENHSAWSKNSPHSLVCVSGSVRRGRKNPLSHIPSSFLSIFTEFSLSFHQHFCLGPFFVMSSCNFLLFSIFLTSRSVILPAFHNCVQSLWPHTQRSLDTTEQEKITMWLNVHGGSYGRFHCLSASLQSQASGLICLYASEIKVSLHGTITAN